MQMSEDLVEIKAEKSPDKLICESCGEKFSCGARIGKCWCFTVEVKAETLAELREDFKNCLCENCLNKLKLERKKCENTEFDRSRLS